MKNFILLVTFLFCSLSIFGQEIRATGKIYKNVSGRTVSKFNLNLAETSDDKSFRKAVYKQSKEYIAKNIDESLFKAALAHNIIKFERPYINFSVWINNEGRPNINFFGSNIDTDKKATKSLRLIVSQLHFDEHFHAGLKRFTNRQLTLFVALEKVTSNGKTTYIVSERTEEEQEAFKQKNKNTYPAYLPSCKSQASDIVKPIEGEIKTVRDCMEYQLIQYLRNNFDKSIAYGALKKLRGSQTIDKPKLKAWISFKYNENGEPCEYQIISLFPKIEKEVLRLIKTFPKATPAEFNGEKIKYKYRIPLKFY